MRALRVKSKAISLLCLLAVLAFGGAASEAGFVQSGKLLVGFEAAIAPTKLPRDRLAPIKAAFAGSFENLDATDTPALRTMQIRISRGGVIEAKGIPTCSMRRLRGTSSSEALGRCRKALLGDGTVRSALRFPDGRRQRSEAKLLLFNASGQILMHIFTTEPLRGTFLVPMKIHRGTGGFATVLDARFPEIAAGHGYLTGFAMVIDRPGYLKASCPAPKGFPRIDFELARVTYRFAGGISVRDSVIDSCKVRG